MKRFALILVMLACAALAIAQPAQSVSSDDAKLLAISQRATIRAQILRGERPLSDLKAALGDGLSVQKKAALGKFKRGAKPSPRVVVANARKFLALHATPPQYVNIPTYLSMWGNDQYGNCTTAETFFARSASAGLKGTDAECITFSQSAGTLDGGIISDVLDFEAGNGCIIGGTTYKSGGKSSVDYTNQLTLFSAITQGPIKIGIDADCLPSGAGNQQGWIVIGAPVMSNYDHCMSITGCGPMSYLAQQMAVTLPAGYDGTKPGVLGYTWSTIGIIDLDSIQNVVCESWLRTPTTVGFPLPTPTPPTPTPVPPSPTPVPPTPTPIPPSPVTTTTITVTGSLAAGTYTVVPAGSVVVPSGSIVVSPTMTIQQLIDQLQQQQPKAKK